MADGPGDDGAREVPMPAVAAELRRLKEESGLSFNKLQMKVPYSRSALQRYLSGEVVVPRDAVRALSMVCGGDSEALLELWDTQAAALAEAAVVTGETAAGPRDDPAPAVGAAQPLPAAVPSPTVPLPAVTVATTSATVPDSASTPAPSPAPSPAPTTAPATALLRRSDSKSGPEPASPAQSADRPIGPNRPERSNRRRIITAWLGLAAVIAAIAFANSLMSPSKTPATLPPDAGLTAGPDGTTATGAGVQAPVATAGGSPTGPAVPGVTTAANGADSGAPGSVPTAAAPGGGTRTTGGATSGGSGGNPGGGQTPPSHFPDASNTGYRKGTSLVPTGDITVDTDGAQISAKAVTGYIMVKADNVTISDVKVTIGSTSDVISGIGLAPGHHGLKIVHTTIVGTGRNGVPAIYNENAVPDPNDLFVDAVDISRAGVGVVTISGVIQNSYIHDPMGSDGLYLIHAVMTAENLRITGDNLDDSAASGSVIDIGGTGNGRNVHDVTISGNRIAGGATSVSGDAARSPADTNIVVRDNVFSTAHFSQCGSQSPDENFPVTGALVWQDNTFDGRPGATVLPNG